MKIGVHTSVRNGFVGALNDAVKLKCTAFQMFTQSPRGWKTRIYTDEEFLEFRKERERSGMETVVVHAPYLPNLCTSDPSLYKKSVDTLEADLTRAEKLGAEFLVIHPGAYSPNSNYQTGLDIITKALNTALSHVKGKSKILIENMAGGGRRLGGPFKQIRDILAGVKDQNRMGVCFDTCHALGAGYDVSNKEGVEKTLKEFDREVGLDRIHVFHVNDSKSPLGSHLDRHEHLGKGFVGLAGLKFLFGYKDFSDCAFILETPKENPESDPENLKKLKSCLSQRHPGESRDPGLKQAFKKGLQPGSRSAKGRIR